MSAVFTYLGVFQTSALSNELIAAGVSLETIHATDGNIRVVCAPGQDRAPVDAAVAAHDSQAPLPHDEARGLALRSPDGSTWRPSIDNSGAVIWLKGPGRGRRP